MTFSLANPKYPRGEEVTDWIKIVKEGMKRPDVIISREFGSVTTD